MRALLTIPLLLLLAAAAEETPFTPSTESFADAAACKARLAVLVAQARSGSFDAAEGPYEVAAGDTRIHTVRGEGNGHRIAEHRCLAEKYAIHYHLVPATERKLKLQTYADNFK